MKIRAFFIFLKECKIQILVSDSAHKFLLIILITFFDETEIKKVAVLPKSETVKTHWFTAKNYCFECYKSSTQKSVEFA